VRFESQREVFVVVVEYCGGLGDGGPTDVVPTARYWPAWPVRIGKIHFVLHRGMKLASE